MSQVGILCIDEHLDWIPLVRIARNCYEQNLVAQLSHNGTAISLQTTRAVQANEELKLWPSIDLLSKLSIPFLKPINIRANLTYQCDRCSIVFQQPNELKIHLAFECFARKFGNPINEVKKSKKVNWR